MWILQVTPADRKRPYEVKRFQFRTKEEAESYSKKLQSKEITRHRELRLKSNQGAVFKYDVYEVENG